MNIFIVLGAVSFILGVTLVISCSLLRKRRIGISPWANADDTDGFKRRSSKAPMDFRPWWKRFRRNRPF